MASPSAFTFISRSADSMRPAGTSRCSRAMAALMSWMVRPWASMRGASYQTRTERSRKPWSCTSPTPWMVWIAGLMTFRM